MKIRILALAVFYALFAAGCAGKAPMGETKAGETPADGNAALVKVYYATDRKPDSGEGKTISFGPERSEKITYGACTVAIPREGRKGDLESTRLWRLVFDDKIKDEVLLTETSTSDLSGFLKDISARVGNSSRKNALFFIHGYNVTFGEAAERTAKLAYDLNFDGAAAFFSWPSKGGLLDYFADGNTIEWSMPHIKSFLEDFITRTGAENVYLIAHSMGNRGFARALAAILTEKPSLSGKIKEIILAAPDVDTGVFRRDIAPALAASKRPITLYAANEDLALSLSKRIHAFARAGGADQGPLILKGIETIEVNSVDSGILHHSYVFEDRRVLADLFYIINMSLRADSRAGLYGVETPAGRYWKFDK